MWNVSAENAFFGAIWDKLREKTQHQKAPHSIPVFTAKKIKLLYNFSWGMNITKLELYIF